MEKKVKLKDVIYIGLIILSGLSSYFVTQNKVNTRLTKIETDITWIKQNVEEVKNIILSID